jgi:hypothetical protein
MIIGYITTKKRTKINTNEIGNYSLKAQLQDNSFDHYNMEQRTIIRLYKGLEKNQYYITLDRNYPNDKYTKAIIKTLAKVLPSNIILTIPVSYLQVQRGCSESPLESYLDEKCKTNKLFHPNYINFLYKRNGQNIMSYRDNNWKSNNGSYNKFEISSEIYTPKSNEIWEGL